MGAWSLIVDDRLFAVSFWHRERPEGDRDIYVYMGGGIKKGVGESFPVLKVTLILVKCSTV